jgi:multidrug resistance efflux pump
MLDTRPPIHNGNKIEALFQSLQSLNSFDGEPSEFLRNLMRVKRFAADAVSAALIKVDSTGKPGLVTAAPPVNLSDPPKWLNIVMENPEKILQTSSINCHFIQILDNTLNSYLVSMPLNINDHRNGIELYILHVKDKKELDRRVEILQLLMPYYSYFEGRIREKEHEAKTLRLYTAFEVLMKISLCKEFLEAALSLCNELASRWSCSRVSFGIFNGRNVKFKALSNSEKFNKKMSIIQNLVSVMEESVDQNMEIVYPQQGAGVYVCRQAQRFSGKYGPLSLLSVPFRYNGKIFGVITLEREEKRPFNNNDIQLLRLIGDLFAPQFFHLKLKDRFFYIKMADGIKQIFSFIIGAKHTWLKLIILLATGSVIWLSQYKVMYKAESTFLFKAEKARIIAAPFSGKISKMFVENGDNVAEEMPLFQLDTTELDLKLKKLQAEKIHLLKKITIAMREYKPAEEQIARAEIKAVEAESNLIRHSINQSIVKATMTGSVVGSDLKKMQFSVVQFGKTIMNLVKTDNLQPLLYIPDDQIIDIKPGQTGELAATGYPDKKIRFRVLTVEKKAVILAQKNVFKAKAEIIDKENLNWIRAGMEGVALVDIEPRLMIWVYTRKAVNWVRMYFWF